MNNPIKLASDPVSKDDIDSLCEWLKQDPTPQLSKGKLTKQYENEWAAFVGRKHSCFVNSGSTANYLMFRILEATNRLGNKKVVVPNLCWITSISPVIQLGLTPILCDINLRDLSVDLNELEKTFSKEKPSIFLLVTILGLVPDMGKIVELCSKYGVLLLIDNCESSGSKYKGRYIEDFGLMCSTSNYVGHQFVAIEGGMICTDDEQCYEMAMFLRSHGWDRDVSPETQKQLRKQYNVSKFQQLYSFYHPAYNFRSTEINAFLGIRSLLKAPLMVIKRNKVFNMYIKYIDPSFWKPEINESSFVCALGYPLISEKRDEIAEALRGNNVECRPLVSGAMNTQPFYLQRYDGCSMPVSERLNDEGMYLPVHPNLSEEDVKFICEIVNRFSK